MLIIIFIIVIILLVHSDYKKEGFVSLDTVNNSYKTTQTQIKNIYNDKGGHVEMKKHMHAGKGINTLGDKITTKYIMGPGHKNLKLHSYPIQMDGGVSGWGGDFNFNRAKIKTNGEFCIDDACINADHLRALNGQRGFSLQSRRTGRRLRDLSKDAKFDNHNDGEHERMRIINIRGW